MVYFLIALSFGIIGLSLNIIYGWSLFKFIKNLWSLIIEMGLKGIDDWEL